MAGGPRLGKRERADVAVIGGGPAGARAAARLAEHGLQVVLLERGGPDRLKPCAGGMPEPVFDRLGLGAEVVECRPRGYQFTMLQDGRPARVLEWPGFRFVTVRRRRFDRALREQAAGRGCEVYCRREVAGWDRQGLLLQSCDSSIGPVGYERDRGQYDRLQARCYLWANGATGSSVRPRGLGFEHRPGNFALAWAAEVAVEGCVRDGGPLEFFLDRTHNPFGYFWRFPVTGGYNVGAGTVSATGRSYESHDRALPRAFAWWLQRALLGRPYRLVWSRAGVIPLRPAGQLVRGLHLALGDAGGLVNPLNGEGVQYALASADAAAETVLTALRTGRLDRLADYPQALWRQRPFLRLGLLAMGLRGLLAFGRRGRRSRYPELVELSHLFFRLRGWLRCSTSS